MKGEVNKLIYMAEQASVDAAKVSYAARLHANAAIAWDRVTKADDATPQQRREAERMVTLENDYAAAINQYMRDHW
jgi:hypothetical protein